MSRAERASAEAFATGFSWPALSAAAVLSVPIALLSGGLLAAASPTAAQRAAADPLLQFAPLLTNPVALPSLAVAMAAAWCALYGLRRDPLRRALRQAAAAAALVLVALPLLRLVVGPHLPLFIPPEEGARPGLPLGLAAGLGEELLFRLLLLPLLLAALGTRTAGKIAAAFAVGLTFAASHELGPGAGTFVAAHFASRFLVPGVGMSLLFLYVGPSFLLALHCGAHLLLPLLFT